MGMTREEAIRIIRKMLACTDLSVRANLNADMVDACHLAIKALEQEPFINKPCISSSVCEHDKNKILDKIRAEIEAMSGDIETIADALDIIDKYKVESEKE